MISERLNLHPDLWSPAEFNLDEILFPPKRVPDFEWSDVDLTCNLTENIKLKLPLISSPMDSVTASDMAIAMALYGGIGVIHYNFPTIEDQMREVEGVRRFEAGFIKNPVVLSSKATVKDYLDAVLKNGFSSYPITSNGKLNGKLLGIVTDKDVYADDLSRPIRDMMTPADKLIYAKKEDTLDKNDIKAANKIIREGKVDTLPVVDKKFRLAALVTRSDLNKNDSFPLATKDDNKQLKVLVAVESRLELAKERIMAAKSFGASGIVVDSRNIFKDSYGIAKFTKTEAPDLDVILGNLVTFEVAYQALMEAGRYFNAFKVGISGGDLCTTAEYLGLGGNLGSDTRNVSNARDKLKYIFGYKGIITDGGNKYPRHFIGGMILGADAVMMGTELAGLDESPGKREFIKQGMVKRARGMGSASAIKERQGAQRYMVTGTNLKERFPEGIEKMVPYKGSGADFLTLFTSGIKQAMHGLGCRNIEDLRHYGYIVPWHKASSKDSV